MNIRYFTAKDTSIRIGIARTLIPHTSESVDTSLMDLEDLEIFYLIDLPFITLSVLFFKA